MIAIHEQLKLNLEHSSALHAHLCPRQVLGVRMSMLAGQVLDVELPQTKKRLLAIVETDGCFADGVAVAANCWVGRRTMRVEDYGKTAVTFVDTATGNAVRIAPHPEARGLAADYALEARNRWEAMLLGYQRMPTPELLQAWWVELATPIPEIVSRPGIRISCEQCGEEIINQREVIQDRRVLCRSCAHPGYYRAPEVLALAATQIYTSIAAEA